MKFTTTNLTPEANTKIAAENPDTSKGYITPSQIVSEATVLDAIKGADPTPSKIGSEFMPDEMLIGSMKFADASAVALPDGSFTGGADPNLLYRHNGVDVGGIPYCPEPENIIRFNKDITAANVSRKMLSTAIRGYVSTGTYVVASFTASSVNSGVAIVENVTVAIGDSGTIIAAKIAAVLQANALITAKYSITTIGPIVYIQCLDATVDAVLTLVMTAGDTTGTSGSSENSLFHYADLGYFQLPASYMVAGSKFIIEGGFVLNKAYTLASQVKIRLLLDGEWSGFISPITSAGCVVDFQNDAQNYARHAISLSNYITLKAVPPLNKLTIAWDSPASVPSHDRGWQTKLNVTSNLPEYVGYLTGVNNGTQSVNLALPSTPTKIRIIALFPYDSTATAGGFVSGKLQLKKLAQWL